MFRHQHKLRETQLSLRPLNDAFSEEIPRGSISYETGHANDVGNQREVGARVTIEVTTSLKSSTSYKGETIGSS